LTLDVSRRGAIALALGGLAVACGGGGEPFRIGYQKNGVLFVARERGGVDAALKPAGDARAVWSEFASGPPLLEALAAKAIDFGATGDAPPIFAQAAGADLVYVATVPLSGRAGAVLVRADSPVRSLVDLKGRKLAYTRGSSAHVAADSLLATVGLSLTDVQSVNLGVADGGPALQRGDVDAWFTWDPFYATAMQTGGLRVLSSGEAGRRSYQFYLADRSFAEGRPQVLSAMLDHLRAEGRWADAHDAEVAGMMSRATGVPEEIQRVVAARQDYAIAPMTAEVAAAQQSLADRLAAEGIAAKRVTVADAVWTGWTPR
jgi:sulfonate transport system substrate-binding protein